MCCLIFHVSLKGYTAMSYVLRCVHFISFHFISFQSSPAQPSPVQSSPVQSSPVQSSPVQFSSLKMHDLFLSCGVTTHTLSCYPSSTQTLQNLAILIYYFSNQHVIYADIIGNGSVSDMAKQMNGHKQSCLFSISRSSYALCCLVLVNMAAK